MKKLFAFSLLLLTSPAYAVLPLMGSSATPPPSTCVPGSPTPDGTLYSAPSNCAINDTAVFPNVWTFGVPYGNVPQDQAFNNALLLNGGTRGFGQQTLSANEMAMADNHAFMFRQRPMGTPTSDCVLNTPAQIWWIVNNAEQSLNYSQTVGPTGPLTGPQFSIGANTYYSLTDATAAVASGQTINMGVPPAGQPYWYASGFLGTSLSNVTILGAQGAAFGCKGDRLGAGQFDIQGSNITLQGADSTHPLTVYGVVGARALNIYSSTTNGVTLQDVDIRLASDCFESSGGTGIFTFTRVAFHHCGDYQLGAGNDHNVYLGWDGFALQPDTQTSVVSGGSSYDIVGDGHQWKTRIASGTFTNFSIYCDTTDFTQCAPDTQVDLTCGGNYTFTSFVMERQNAQNNGQAFIKFAPEETSNNVGNPCTGMNYHPVNLHSGSAVIDGWATDPAILGIGAGDDISDCGATPALQLQCSDHFPRHSTVVSVDSGTGCSANCIVVSSPSNADVTGEWIMNVGPRHFTANTVTGTNQITGLTINPTPPGTPKRSQCCGTVFDGVQWDGIWPGYLVQGPGIPPNTTVASTSGTGPYTITLDCLNCITSTNTGAAYTASRNNTVLIDSAWIINDNTTDPGAQIPIVLVNNLPWFTATGSVTVQNSRIVNNPIDGNTIRFGGQLYGGHAVTIGPGNLCYANRTDAGLAAFPSIPLPPTIGSPIPNGKEIPCPTS